MPDPDDLFYILRYIDRPETLARHPLTRKFLEAGVRILEKRFSGTEPGECGQEPGTFSLDLVGRNEVIGEVADDEGTVGKFADRWSVLSNYLGDLILYTLRPRAWQERTRLASQASDALNSHRFSKI